MRKQFEVIIEDRHYPISVDSSDIDEGLGFFNKMDKDMDGGWRMGIEFVHHPNALQRCQIVAERLMLAIESGHQALQTAMAAYLLWRIPHIQTLAIDTSGDPSLTEILTDHGVA